MGKRSRQKRQRRQEAQRRGGREIADDQISSSQAPAFAWADDEGLHTLLPGTPPTNAELEKLTHIVHEKMRHSPEWAQIVAQLGPDEAERLLEQIRFELR